MAIAEKAKEKQVGTLKQNAVNQKSDERKEVNTAKELAKIAGNMRFFYSYVTKIYFPNLTN